MASLWVETPLIYSQHISRVLQCDVYLKLEHLQPSHSFKQRGISLFIQRAKERHGPDVHAIIASGGNAGLAAATAANLANVRCTVFLPVGAAQRTVDLMRGENAEVVVIGKMYSEALNAAREAVAKESNAVMVPAYDDPTLFEGHASMVDEIVKQAPRKPDAMFCSVGGGGLLGGLIVGCKRNGWDDLPLVSMETLGSNCFHYSVLFNGDRKSDFSRKIPSHIQEVIDPESRVKFAHQAAFSSIASGSLGASRPALEVLKSSLTRVGGIKCASVSDELAMHAAVAFARDHKILVEPSCSTTLTAGYNPHLFDRLVPPKKNRMVVFIVCGGFKISAKDIAQYEIMLEESVAQEGEKWIAVVDDGELVPIDKHLA